MILDDIDDGDSLFLDANTLVYHFSALANRSTSPSARPAPSGIAPSAAALDPVDFATRSC